MEILARMGRVDEALALLDQFIATNDTIKNVEVNARFDELRTQYEVEKHIAGKERNFHYLLFALAICLVLALLLAGAFYYNRTIALKNRKLYERIKEQDRLADELSRLENIRQSESSPEDSGKQPELRNYLHLPANSRIWLFDCRSICSPMITCPILTLTAMI